MKDLGLTQKLLKMQEEQNFGNYEHLNEAIENIVPDDYLVVVFCDSVSVFDSIEDVEEFLTDKNLDSFYENEIFEKDGLWIKII